MVEERRSDVFIKPGTRVRYDGLVEGGPEYGVVVHCWSEEDIGGRWDCHVAFFGSEFPKGRPPEKPYVLRYAATSLVVLDGRQSSP